jgi:hypothetical protein
MAMLRKSPGSYLIGLDGAKLQQNQAEGSSSKALYEAREKRRLHSVPRGLDVGPAPSALATFEVSLISWQVMVTENLQFW